MLARSCCSEIPPLDNNNNNNSPARSLVRACLVQCFVSESTHATDDLHAGHSSAGHGERWMNELGVAFVQRDKHDRGFLWSANRLLPSQAGRAHSEKLLARFRRLCEHLELEAWTEEWRAQQAAAAPPAAPLRARSCGCVWLWGVGTPNANQSGSASGVV